MEIPESGVNEGKAFMCICSASLKCLYIASSTGKISFIYFLIFFLIFGKFHALNFFFLDATRSIL